MQANERGRRAQDRALLRGILVAAERFRLNSIELGALCGFSDVVALRIMRGRELPKLPRCILGCERFVARAEKALSRSDLGLPS